MGSRIFVVLVSILILLSYAKARFARIALANRNNSLISRRSKWHDSTSSPLCALWNHSKRDALPPGKNGEQHAC